MTSDMAWVCVGVGVYVCFWVMCCCWAAEWSHCRETCKSDQTQQIQMKKSVLPHWIYTTQYTASDLLFWRGLPVSVRPARELFPLFSFHVWCLCCHGYHVQTRFELLHRLSVVLNWSVSMFKSSQDSSFFRLTLRLSLFFLLKGCIFSASHKNKWGLLMASCLWLHFIL